MKTLWHEISYLEALKKLRVTSDGLSEKEAKKRLKKFGLNKLPREKRLSRVKIFLRQFKNPLIYILAIATLISFLLGHFTDANIILAVVAVSILVGFIQENKANQAVSRLIKMVKHEARVLRDRQEKRLPVEKLVPGDIILLESGDKVPADARLIETHNLQVIEAALTGESMPSEKHNRALSKDTLLADRENGVYLGTVVSRGRAKAVVCQTGLKTELGKIAALVKEAKEEKTPLQKQLLKLSKFLGLVILGVSLIIFLAGWMEGRDLFEMFFVAVAIAVAAIPEGLLAALTVLLAVGMQRILKHKGLVRKLVAAETLGSVSVILTDKTGTLTKAQMEVSKILTYSGRENKDLLLQAFIYTISARVENPRDNFNNWRYAGVPTETALLKFALRKEELRQVFLQKEKFILDEIPFDTQYKLQATLIKGQKQNTIYILGAPEIVLEKATFLFKNGKPLPIKSYLGELEKEIQILTNEGLRVLGAAFKEMPPDRKELKSLESLNENVFLGLVALKDPLRDNVKNTLKLTQKAGIRTIIVTGDHLLTAKAIAKDLGLKVTLENAIDGKALFKMSETELGQKIKDILIFARVTPKDKVRILEALKSQGKVVAMTGDGINDAPALTRADIGVAVGSGTDVAKEASDLIILDDNFRTIVWAIKEGRIIFENIRKVVLYLLSDGFTEVILIGGAVLLSFFDRFSNLPLPLLPAQILWIKLVEDTSPSMALAFEKEEEGVMSEPPRKLEEPIINRAVKAVLIIFASVSSLTLFGLFYYFWKTSGNIDYARSIVFVGIGLESMFYVFSCRSLKRSIIHLNPFKNIYLVSAVIFGLTMIVTALYVPFFQGILKTIPLGIKEWLVLIGFGFFNILIFEIVKWFLLIKPSKKSKN